MGESEDRLALFFNAGGELVTFALPGELNADPATFKRLLCSAEGSYQALEAPGSSLTIVGFRSA